MRFSVSLSRAAAGAAFVFCALTFAPASALADESSAETLFQEGLAAMKRNDYPVACEAFLGSNKADPSPGTQINLAVCYEKQKKWASAFTWYRSAVGLAQTRNQGDREKLAEDAANRIRPSIHYVIVSVKESLTDLVVKRDGVEVTIVVAGKEVPLAVDPGKHTFEVSARGKKAWSTEITCPDDPKTERVEVPKLVDAPVDDKAGPGGAAYQPPVIITNDGGTQRTVGLVVGGAGILAGVASAGLFLLAKSEENKRKELREGAVNKPPAERAADDESAESHQSAAENNQLMAIIFAVGAGVLVGTGAFIYFTAPKSQSAATSGQLHKPKILPHPFMTPTSGGLGLSGTF